jgi:hypothetical protein
MPISFKKSLPPDANVASGRSVAGSLNPFGEDSSGRDNLAPAGLSRIEFGVGPWLAAIGEFRSGRRRMRVSTRPINR